MADCSLDEYISKRGIATFNKKGFRDRLGFQKNTGVNGSKIYLEGPRILNNSTTGPTVIAPEIKVQVSNEMFDARARIKAKAQPSSSVQDARQKLTQKAPVSDARQRILQKKQSQMIKQPQQTVQGNIPQHNQLFGNMQQQQTNMFNQQLPGQHQKPFQLQPVMFGAQQEQRKAFNNFGMPEPGKTRVLLTTGVRSNSVVKQNEINQPQAQRTGISSRLQGRLGGGGGQQNINNNNGSQPVGTATEAIAEQVQQFHAKVQQRQSFMQQQQLSHSQQHLGQQRPQQQQAVKMQQQQAVRMQQQQAVRMQQQQAVRMQHPVRQQLPLQSGQMQQQQTHFPPQQHMQPRYMQPQQPRNMQQLMQPAEMEQLYDMDEEESGMDDEDMYGYDSQPYSSDNFNEGSGIVTFHAGSIQKVIGGNVQLQQQHLMDSANNMTSGRQALKRTSYDVDQQQYQQPPHVEAFSRPPPLKLVRREEANIHQQQQQQQMRQQQQRFPQQHLPQQRQQLPEQQQPLHQQQFPQQEKQAKDAEYTSPLQGVRVTIGNLLPVVTLDDIVELFGAIGAVKRARFVRPGLAEVVFVEEQAAVKAMKRYHQRELDGQPMQVVIQNKLSGQTVRKPVAGQTVRSSSAGDPSSIELDPDVLHRALFKTSSTVDPARPNGPVNFTVHM